MNFLLQRLSVPGPPSSNHPGHCPGNYSAGPGNLTDAKTV